MNTEVFIILLFIIATCIVPFVIINRINKNTEKKFLHELFAFAEKHHSKITQYDVVANLAIGFSEADNTLYFIKKVNDDKIMEYVKISAALKCYMNRTSLSSPDGNYVTTNKVELRFNYSEQGKPESVFTFYDSERDSLNLRGELPLAEKWCRVVNDRMPRVQTLP